MLLLAPLAPHLAEELWAAARSRRIARVSPVAASGPGAICSADVLEIPVQVNGKVRGKISGARGSRRGRSLEIARADHNVGKHLAGQTVKRAIYVRGRIVNFVVGGN